MAKISKCQKLSWYKKRCSVRNSSFKMDLYGSIKASHYPFKSGCVCCLLRRNIFNENLLCCSLCNFFNVYLYYMNIMGNKKICGENLKNDSIKSITPPHVNSSLLNIRVINNGDIRDGNRPLDVCSFFYTSRENQDITRSKSWNIGLILKSRAWDIAFTIVSKCGLLLGLKRRRSWEVNGQLSTLLVVGFAAILRRLGISSYFNSKLILELKDFEFNWKSSNNLSQRGQLWHIRSLKLWRSATLSSIVAFIFRMDMESNRWITPERSVFFFQEDGTHLF